MSLNSLARPLLAENKLGGSGVVDISCDMAATPSPAWKMDRVHD